MISLFLRELACDCNLTTCASVVSETERLVVRSGILIEIVQVRNEITNEKVWSRIGCKNEGGIWQPNGATAAAIMQRMLAQTCRT